MGSHITYYFDKNVYLAKSWEEILDENVNEFNKKHANVMINGKNRIMRLEPGTSISEGRMTYAFFARNELSKVYDNTKILTLGKEYVHKPSILEYKNIFMAWVTNPRARTYIGGVVFLPGKKANDGYFNTWMGFGVEPNKDSRLFKSINFHIKNVICSGDSDLYNYFMSWIAYTIQNPDKQAGVAVVLRGEKGTGKSIVGHFLRKIWGNHGLHITNPKHLVGNFNGHLADTCFLFADEAFFAGDKANENLLKGLVTEPMFIIERKGLDATQQPNYLKILMVTNAEYVVPVSRDERRYCVIDVSRLYTEPEKNSRYFEILTKYLDDPRVSSAFLYEMQNYDLSNWDIRVIPESRGLRDQRYHSMNSVQHWLADSLKNGTFDTSVSNNYGISWLESITTEQLYKSYLEWSTGARRGEYGREVPECVMSEYLGKIYVKEKRVEGTQKRGITFGTLENAVELFETYEKVSLEELPE